MIGKKLEIFLWCWWSSRSEKKGFGKECERRKFWWCSGLRVYDVEKIEEDGEEKDGKEGKIWPKKTFQMSHDPSNLTEGVLLFNGSSWRGQVVMKKSLWYQAKNVNNWGE